MRLLTRISIFCIVLGLIVGLLLRRRIKSVLALMTISFLPWLIHIIYVLVSVLDIPLLHLGIFVLSNLLILLILLAVAWRSLKARRLWVALLPILQGFIYSLSLLWFVRIVSVDGLGLNSLSWVAYAGAALAMSGMLFGYLFRLSAPNLGSLIKRRK